MKLILAEKPSVARDIAKAFSRVREGNGFFKAKDEELGEFYITWCFGHMFEIDTKKIAKRGELLPLPDRFEYRLRRGARKQFGVIKKLVEKVEEVYIFTDPEREGELIARIVLTEAGWRKWNRTFRMWTSRALVPEVVREEIKARRPAENYDSVFWEALARQHGDWLVGIPLSRVLMRVFRGKWSVGRVQTPALTLLVLREEEIRNFKPQPYVVIKGVFGDGKEDFEATLWKEEKSGGEGGGAGGDADVEGDEGDEKEGEGRSVRISPKEAGEIIGYVERVRKGKVVKVWRRRRREPPPLLHSLTSLQQEASKLYGFSARRTLDVAQKLYERKLISYPRTESHHLSSGDRDLVKKVLLRLGKKELVERVDRVGKRVFDDAKLTDHFALIPLAPLPENVTEEERKVYFLIWRRFVGAFTDRFEYEETDVLISVGKYTFRARGRRVIRLGWRELYGEAEDRLLPELKTGQTVTLKKVKKEKRLTEPPPRYTEGNMVKKMEKLGIGTPATRSEILEALKKRGYVRSGRKQLLPTDKGVKLVKGLLKLKTPLTSPELTAEWEKRLKEIRMKKKGKRGYEEFIRDIKEFVKEQARKLMSLKTGPGPRPRKS